MSRLWYWSRIPPFPVLSAVIYGLQKAYSATVDMVTNSLLFRYTCILVGQMGNATLDALSVSGIISTTFVLSL